MILKTMPNHFLGVVTQQEHELSLPECCPVSGNPKPGSFIQISYKPTDRHLEVYSLRELLDSFIGGRPDPDSGRVVIRDMEGMIQAITQECADAVGVEVRVVAKLVLNGEPVSTMQGMTLRCTATPQSSVPGEVVLPIVRDVDRLQKVVIQLATGTRVSVGIWPTNDLPSCLVWRSKLFLSGAAQYQGLTDVDYLESTFVQFDETSIGEFVRIATANGTFIANAMIPTGQDGYLPGVIRYGDTFFFLSSEPYCYEQAIAQPAYDLGREDD